jgi:hypothetical protein
MAWEQIDVYVPQVNLTICQKGAYYLDEKIFNNLPRKIKNVADQVKKFKTALKQFCYTLD